MSANRQDQAVLLAYLEATYGLKEPLKTPPPELAFALPEGTEVALLLTRLRADGRLYLDTLSNLSATDNLPQPSLDLWYHLRSLITGVRLSLRLRIGREVGTPVHSITHIYPPAEWMEREAHEMHGVVFTGHPDPRYLLLPADWQGHPLRKDYVEQTMYQDMAVPYSARRDS